MSAPAKAPAVFPSEPPPSRDDAVQPMSWVVAALWVGGATIAFLLLASFAGLVLRQPASPKSQTVFVACQACAYALVVLWIRRRYAASIAIDAMLGLRGTHAGFYPLATVLGASSAVWASWLLERIHRNFSPADRHDKLDQLFFEAGGGERLAMTAAIVVVGPLCEELLFRGALFQPMTKQHRVGTVIVASAAMFAIVHGEPTVMVPLFLLGLTLGYLRAATGSLLPPFLFHLAFNGTMMADLFLSAGAPGPRDPPEDLPRGLMLASLGAFAAAFFVTAWLAERSERAGGARQAAMDC